MELSFECPGCGKVNHVPKVESAERLKCAHCSWERAVASGAIDQASLAACPVCATEDLYLQKDFPHVLGLSIVVAGFIISSIFWAYYLPIPALGVLLGTAALDLVLYYLVPDVTICYRCLSQLRGAGSNPGGRVHAFDLAIGERYRQERLRVEELRKRQQTADHA